MTSGKSKLQEIEKTKAFIQRNPNYKVSDIQRLLLKGYKYCCLLLEEMGVRNG